MSKNSYTMMLMCCMMMRGSAFGVYNGSSRP